MSELPAIVDLDCRGMRCPQPILEISRAARESDGEPTVLRIVATDGSFPTDIEAWCRTTRHALVGLERGSGEYRATLSLHGARCDASISGGHPTVGSEEQDEIAGAPSVPTLKLDCMGLIGVDPMLRVAAAARENGEQPAILLVHGDAPAFRRQMAAWCRTAGATALGWEEQDGGTEVRIGLGGVDALVSGSGLPAVTLPGGEIPTAPEESPPAAPIDGGTDSSSLAFDDTAALECVDEPANEPANEPADAPLGLVHASERRADDTLGDDDAPWVPDPFGGVVLFEAHKTATQTMRALSEADLAEPTPPGPPAPPDDWAGAETDRHHVPAEVLVAADATPSPAPVAEIPRVWIDRATPQVRQDDPRALASALLAASAGLAPPRVVVAHWGVRALRADAPGWGPRGFFARLRARFAPAWSAPATPDEAVRRVIAGDLPDLRAAASIAAAQGVEVLVCAASLTGAGIEAASLHSALPARVVRLRGR